jgi:hypothetical protein
MFVDFCEDSHEAEQEKNKKQHRKRNEEMFLSTLSWLKGRILGDL